MAVIQMTDRRVNARNDPAFLLAIIYTLGFYGFVIALLSLEIPRANKDLVGQLLPVLSMIQGGIIQYFYNKASQVSRDKSDDTIKKLTETVQSTAAAAATLLPTGATPNADKAINTDINVSADTANIVGTESNTASDKGKGT